MEIDVRSYVQPDGSCPFEDWYLRLPLEHRRKVTITLNRIVGGNTASIKWFDGTGELRIDWGPGYRVYLLQDGKRMILLLGGGTKKRQEADIRVALALRDEHKRERKPG